MVHSLISWAVNSRLVVILLAISLLAVGLYSFHEINVEAYPDPAPAIVEVVAQYPGASAEEMERQVTIPLEVAFAGMPGLASTRTKSLFALSYLRNQFEYGVDFDQAKQEVINRLQFMQLPPGVSPQISPESPTGEIYRYTVDNARDANGKPIYSLNDLKALEDWTLEKEFKRIKRIADVASFGGTVKRYEVLPDPDRMKRYGITLAQIQAAIAGSNINVGGDYLTTGHTVQVVRGLGLFGNGEDPVQHVLGVQSPLAARNYLRDQERRRIDEILQVPLTAVNNVPVTVGNVVDGGPERIGDYPSDAQPRGAVVGHQTRLGQVSCDRPKKDAQGHEIHDAHGQRVWDINDDAVEGIVLLRKGESSLPALRDVEAKVQDLNDRPGRLLPGAKVNPYYDRTDLMNVTTDTVQENLVIGMTLVSLVLLMFLSNVRAAIIVAINIPLALLFAFAVLYLRGKSANLLSIGAVDFGIIVDSSVIMVENIYRHLSSGHGGHETIQKRVIRAAGEVERSLFFSTLILVCALLPLFTMTGPEGQLFGPMADTYAFALGGALLLTVTLSPVLCTLLLKNVRVKPDNFLVRTLKRIALAFLGVCLRWRVAFLGVVGLLVAGTIAVLPFLGSEFMPQLEEGNLWIRGNFPVTMSLDEVTHKCQLAREIMRGYPEIELVTTEIGRPDDGTDPSGQYNTQYFVPLKPFGSWPAMKKQEGLLGWFRAARPRTKAELVEDMNAELEKNLIGVDWNFSQNIRDNVMEALSGVQGDNAVKIFGPDLVDLERIAEQARIRLTAIRGIADVGIEHVQGQTNLEFCVDRERIAKWGLNAADVNNAIETALKGKVFTQMVEGERTFDITLRWPERLRLDPNQILDIPIDVPGNTVTPSTIASIAPTPVSGASTGFSAQGTSLAPASLTGNQFNGSMPANSPRRRIRDVVKPPEDAGSSGATKGSFVRNGATVIYRDNGNRMIAVKFSVRGRDLVSAVAEAKEKTADLIQAPYRTDWSGEFEEMEQAQRRLLAAGLLSLALILALLYMAFHSLRDAAVVLSSVVSVSMGGIWALLLTHESFTISAGVGSISIVGVAIMNGLLLVSTFNQLRARGLQVQDAIEQGVEKLVRPIIMTALAAIFGLLPAALSTRIGSQTQRPLAIVVIGGMAVTLVLTTIIPVLYSFYGHREPPEGAGHLAH